jgi:hypothetical protein
MSQVFVQGQAIAAMADGAAETLNRMRAGDFFKTEMAGQATLPDIPLGQVNFFDLQVMMGGFLDPFPFPIGFLMPDAEQGGQENQGGCKKEKGLFLHRQAL